MSTGPLMNFMGVLLMVVVFEAGAARELRAAEPATRRPNYRYLFPDTQYHVARSDDRAEMHGRERECCVQKGDGYDIAFIEFDERGDFWDRDQLKIARAQFRRRTAGKVPLLIEYVHGWHHNGQEDAARDVAGFRNLLSFLGKSEYLKDFRVFGVYLAWRGEKVRSGKDPLGRLFWLPSQLSFYSIKQIGNEVGTMPMISEALFWMVHEARSAPRPGRSVLMGHSFGAMVLENAIAQAVASSSAMQFDGGRSLPAPADLVLLLNSAANSLRAKGLIEMLDRMGRGAGERYINAERPLVVSVTSEGDWATGKFFPLGTGISNAFRKTREYEDEKNDPDIPHGTSQRKFITQTPGHNELLRSHVVAVDRAKIAPSTRKAADGTAARQIFELNLKAPLAKAASARGNVWPFRSLAKTGEPCVSVIRPFDKARMRTGYWIVRVPKEIIYDHGDIFNEQALALYAAIYRIANPSQAKEEAGARRLMVPALQTDEVREPKAGHRR